MATIKLKITSGGRTYDLSLENLYFNDQNTIPIDIVLPNDPSVGVLPNASRPSSNVRHVMLVDDIPDLSDPDDDFNSPPNILRTQQMRQSFAHPDTQPRMQSRMQSSTHPNITSPQHADRNIESSTNLDNTIDPSDMRAIRDMNTAINILESTQRTSEIKTDEVPSNVPSSSQVDDTQPSGQPQPPGQPQSPESLQPIIYIPQAGNPSRAKVPVSEIMKIMPNQPTTQAEHDNRDMFRTTFSTLDDWLRCMMNVVDPVTVEFAKVLDKAFSQYLLKMPLHLSDDDFARMIHIMSIPIRAQGVTENVNILKQIMIGIRQGLLNEVINALNSPGCECAFCKL